LLQPDELTSTHESSCSKPPQQRFEIGQQFSRFAILHWTRIEKVQRQVVADEEKAVFPVIDPGDSTGAHTLPEKIIKHQ
jgi:hypothetical protein